LGKLLGISVLGGFILSNSSGVENYVIKKTSRQRDIKSLERVRQYQTWKKIIDVQGSEGGLPKKADGRQEKKTVKGVPTTSRVGYGTPS